jgi:hypothetical protein
MPKGLNLTFLTPLVTSASEIASAAARLSHPASRLASFAGIPGIKGFEIASIKPGKKRLVTSQPTSSTTFQSGSETQFDKFHEALSFHSRTAAKNSFARSLLSGASASSGFARLKSKASRALLEGQNAALLVQTTRRLVAGSEPLAYTTPGRVSAVGNTAAKADGHSIIRRSRGTWPTIARVISKLRSALPAGARAASNWRPSSEGTDSRIRLPGSLANNMATGRSSARTRGHSIVRSALGSSWPNLNRTLATSLGYEKAIKKWGALGQGTLALSRGAEAVTRLPPLARSTRLTISENSKAAARPAPVVLNSSPTVVINTRESDDIEQRVLAILREHRADLYTQWSRELQRRERTEF